jgi:hypothetical protein
MSEFKGYDYDSEEDSVSIRTRTTSPNRIASRRGISPVRSTSPVKIVSSRSTLPRRTVSNRSTSPVKSTSPNRPSLSRSTSPRRTSPVRPSLSRSTSPNRSTRRASPEREEKTIIHQRVASPSSRRLSTSEKSRSPYKGSSSTGRRFPTEEKNLHPRQIKKPIAPKLKTTSGIINTPLIPLYAAEFLSPEDLVNFAKAIPRDKSKGIGEVIPDQVTVVMDSDVKDSDIEDISTFPNLKRLTIPNCFYLSGEALAVLFGNTHLEYLELGNLTPKAAKSLKYLNEMQSLTTLVLRGGNLMSSNLVFPITDSITSFTMSFLPASENLINSIANFRKLKTLELDEFNRPIFEVPHETMTIRVTQSMELNFLQFLPELESLTIGLSDSDNLTLGDMQNIAALPELKSLSLKNTNLSSLVRELRKAINLTKLEFLNCHLKVGSFSTLSTLVNLKYLSMTDNQNNYIDNEMLTTIANFTQLETLILAKDYYNILITTLEPIADLTSLTILDVSGCESLTTVGASYIANLKNLTSLNFHESGVTSDILEYIRKLPHLAELNLNGIRGDFEPYIHDLSNNKKLTKLILINTRINSTCIKVISTLTHLTYLDISLVNSNYSDEDLKNIAKLERLAVLKISSNDNITTLGVSYLITLKFLLELDLEDCLDITDDIFSVLSSFLRLRVVNLNGTSITQEELALFKKIDSTIDIRFTLPEKNPYRLFGGDGTLEYETTDSLLEQWDKICHTLSKSDIAKVMLNQHVTVRPIYETVVNMNKREMREYLDQNRFEGGNLDLIKKYSFVELEFITKIYLSGLTRTYLCELLRITFEEYPQSLRRL